MMHEWFEFARWCAGSVLIVSGVLKIGRAHELLRSLEEMGVPPRFVEPGWIRALVIPAFPFAEIAVGVGTLIVPSHFFPALSALLYAAFLIAVTRSVGAGRDASCDCFGGFGDSRVTRRTIARNTLLLLLALAGLGAGSTPLLALSARGGVLIGVLAIAIPFAAALGMVLWRPRLQRRRARSVASSLVLRSADGRPTPLSEFAEPPTYLVFFSSGCGKCRDLVDRFRWWPNAAPEGVDVQPVFLGTPEAFAGIEQFEPLAPYAWYDHDRSVGEALGLAGTPGVVLVDTAHPLGDGWVGGAKRGEAYVVRPGFYDEIAAAQQGTHDQTRANS